MNHPFFYTLVRLQARAQLRKQGKRFAEINEIMAGAADEVIDVAKAQTSPDTQVDSGVGAIGDGAIIQAIRDFLASDLGQMLIQVLLALLGL